MLRSIIAFLVAPLAVLFLYVAVPFYPDVRIEDIELVGLVIIPVAYAGTFLIGLPTYLYLQRRGWTAFWVAPIAGFGVATATWLVLVTLVPAFFLPRLTQLATLLNIFWPAGPIGAITAALLWLIARPDRTYR